LILASGHYTRLLPYLQDDKYYRAIGVLGSTTETLDAQHPAMVAMDVPVITSQQLESVVRLFNGPIQQRPPLTSAIKVNGQKLYQLAHQNQTIDPEEIPVRDVILHRCEVLDYQLNLRQFTLDVHCSSGTYIRTLIGDIAQQLKTVGLMLFLNRYQVGGINQAVAQSLEDFRDNPTPLDIQTVLPNIPLLELDETQQQDLGFGRQLTLSVQGDLVFGVDDKQQLLGLLKQTTHNKNFFQPLMVFKS
jgi:tRNA pseudouridine55 synthase